MANRISRDPATGQLAATVNPEDWRFAHWAASNGLVVRATRKAKVWHTGIFQYPSDVAWGEWETDREYKGIL